MTDKQLVDEYLANGGTITQVPDNNFTYIEYEAPDEGVLETDAWYDKDTQTMPTGSYLGSCGIHSTEVGF